MNEGWIGALMFAGTYLVGFLPVQWLPSRRASIVAAVIGLLAIPVGLLILRIYPITLNTLGVLVGVLWLMLTGVAVFFGSATRAYILGRTNLASRDCRLVTAVLGTAFSMLEFALLRWAGSYLD